MIVIKDKNSINKMRTAGKLIAEIMEKVKNIISPNISTFEIDVFIEKSMVAVGLKPVCKGYAGYKFATCISLNNVVIHGIPSKDILLKSGDLLKIDVVGSYKNYCADITRSYYVEEVSSVVKKITQVAQFSLDLAIKECFVGNFLSNLSATMQQEVEKFGFGVVRDFAGHGIGRDIHESPEIPNYGKFGEGPLLRSGMTFAIEPMITEKSYKVFVDSDGWTVKTVDGGLAAHVEDTVLITENGPEVLTRL